MDQYTAGAGYNGHTPENKDALTSEESKAIAGLRRIASRWPKSLLLASMDGELVVFRNDESRMDEAGGLNQDATIAEITGIPNTGGGW